MKSFAIILFACFAFFTNVEAQTSGCTGTATISVTIEDCTSTSNLAGIKLFEVSPNPANELIRIAFQVNDNTAGTLRLIDASGKNFHQERINISGEIVKTIKIDQIPGGIYWVVFQTESGVASRKVVIE